jgi:ribose/xylose/arabinose/galactoside ABC-type transport system permease subunit
MVTAKLMLAGVDPFLAALIGGVLVGGALGAINGCLVNWTGLHPFIITLGTNAIFAASPWLSPMPTRCTASRSISLTSLPPAYWVSRFRSSSR